MVTKTTDGAIEVVDFKSGTIVDDGEEPLQRYATQVWLYALAIEKVLGTPPVRLYLEGGERVPVPWNIDVRESCTQLLTDVLDEFQQGDALSASEVGRPGPWCRLCRLRPCCPAYLDAVPKWWPNNGGAPRPLPLDVWGTVRDIRASAGGVTVEIEDCAGRSVRIEGLDERRGVDELDAGDAIYFFGLEATEPMIHHGSRLQPRNFHEMPPDGGLKLRTATALQVYRG
jgi:hypothetical protein